jgi:hypothetical protein
MSVDGDRVCSSDLEIQGIPELHRHCSRYLSQYDQVCAEYLGAIQAELPLEVDANTWSVLRVTQKTLRT